MQCCDGVLIYSKAISDGNRDPASGSRCFQGFTDLEAKRVARLASRHRLDQGSSDVLHAVSFFSLRTAQLTVPRSSAILVAVFKIIGDLLDSNNTVITATLLTLSSPTVLSILGNRMFFNLKDAAEHGVNIGTNWSSYSQSSIHFDLPAQGESL